MRPGPVRTLSAIAFAVACFYGGGASAQTAGSVIGISGQINLQRGGQPYALRIGDAVYPTDTLEVPIGSKLKLRMNDGSILSVAPGSVLRIDTYAVDATGRRQAVGLSLGQGLLRSVTAPVDRPASFEVNTAVGTAAVRSTDWFVETIPGAEEVSVLTGSVALTNRSGASVLVPPHMASELDVGGAPQPPRPVSEAEFNALLARTENGAPPPAPQPAPGGYAPPPGLLQLPVIIPGIGIGGHGGGYRGGDRGGERGGSHSDDHGTYSR